MDEDPILQQLRSPQASGFDIATPSTSSLNGNDIIVATPATSASSETPKTSRKRKAPIKKLKVSEKQSVSDDCSSSAAALEKAKLHLPKKHDIKLCLSSLVPYPFYRQIDPAYVEKINQMVESKQFDLKRTTFTVCEDPASGKYLVLDGNHRVTSFLEKYGIDCTHEFDCIVYGHLSKEQLFAISLALTEPAMSLEMRFLDQVNIFRKYRQARGLQRTKRIYDDQMDLGSKLVGKPNQYALEIAQWSDEDYAIVASYILEFQNNNILEHPERNYIHYSNLTEDCKLPDLKAGTFWKCIMQGCKTDKNYTLSLMKMQASGRYLTIHEVKEAAKNQPKFLLRLKRMGIIYQTLEAASKDLCDGMVYTDAQLMSAINSRIHLAHIGQDNKHCTVANLKRKLKLELSGSVAPNVSDRIITFTPEKFEADLVFLKFVIVSTEYIDHETLLKITASLDSDATLILLGSFDSNEIYKSLSCVTSTFSSSVMLQERLFDTVVGEPFNNALNISFFVKRSDQVVPVDIAFIDKFFNLPLNNILSVSSFETLLAASASYYDPSTSNMLFIMPPVSSSVTKYVSKSKENFTKKNLFCDFWSTSENLYILPSYIENIFSKNAHLILKKIIENLNESEKEKTAIVIRRFETSHFTEIPENVQQLVKSLEEKRVFNFHHHYFGKNHLIPNLNEWINESLFSNETSVKQIKYQYFWEPLTVTHRSSPPYFEGLLYRYRNQIAYVYELCRAKFKFVVASHIFTIHKGIKKKLTRNEKFYMQEYWEKSFQTWNNFEEMIKLKYPDTEKFCEKK